MRWTRGDRSNVDDVRGGGGGGGVGIPLGIGGVLVLLVGSWLTGVNLFDIVGGGAATDVVADRPAVSSPEEEKMVDFVDAVMGDIQSTWSAKLGSYQPTRAVLFRDSIQSACGLSSSATGPFYCPADRKVYLDLGFFGALDSKLGAPGDFAQAYVLAHEAGHHVQNLMSTLDSGPFNGSANERSVRVELQADCYAGVWGHEAAQPGRAAAGRVELDPGDVEEGLGAAAAVGDDRLQQQGRGRVVPESFTHGSSAQRVSWFRRGMETGDPRACDTFADAR
ncbi:MAG TPA: neutral zinc metallopeptidase [Vicinamibacterales bacterium]|nr:neutral zinc metallopeptidase [Vicinamibacterales bacterium]